MKPSDHAETKTWKYHFANPSGTTTVPFELSRHGLFFEIKVNSLGPLWFSLDSGSATNYLDIDVAKEIGVRFQGSKTVQGAGQGRVPVQVAENVTFELPGLCSEGHQIHSLKLPAHEQWGHQLDGFFGYNFLERFITIIDYQAKRLTVTDPSTYDYDGDGEILPLEFDDRLPYVRARITVPGNLPEESLFLVDTGSQDEVDHPLIAKSSRTTRTRVGVGFGRPSRGVFGPVETLQLGTIKLHDLSGVAGVEGLGSHLIGSGVLHRFKIILDYPHNRMILET